MSRPKKCRCCRTLDAERIYRPAGAPIKNSKVRELHCDEIEALRRVDLEGLSQIEAAKKMKISRGTVQRLLDRGRRTILETLLAGDSLRVRNTEDDLA